MRGTDAMSGQMYLLFKLAVAELADGLSVEDASPGPGSDLLSLRSPLVPDEYMLVGGIDGGSLFDSPSMELKNFLATPVDSLCINTYKSSPDPLLDGDLVGHYYTSTEFMSLEAAVAVVQACIQQWLGTDDLKREDATKVYFYEAFGIRIYLDHEGFMNKEQFDLALSSANALATRDWLAARDGLLDLAKNAMGRVDVKVAADLMKIVEKATALRNRIPNRD